MPIEQRIFGYFETLNPVAEKIAFDISAVKSAYDHVWLTLTATEQDNILNDTLIRPEITIRYYTILTKGTTISRSPTEDGATLSVQNRNKGVNRQKHDTIYTYDRQSLRTFTFQNVGFKILHDENIRDYRDEHSFPFSYKTKSQINLAVIASNTNDPEIEIKTENNTENAIDLCKPYLQKSTKSLAFVQRKDLSESPDHHKQKRLLKTEPHQLNDQKYFESIYLDANEKLNLLSNFGSTNTLLSISSTDSTDFENDTKEQLAENCKLLPTEVQIPKGFDFLSNW